MHMCLHLHHLNTNLFLSPLFLCFSSPSSLIFLLLLLLFLLQAMFDTEPKLDHAPIVSYVALSSIDTGHSKGVTDVEWVPENLEVREREREKIITFYSFLQYSTCILFVIIFHRYHTKHFNSFPTLQTFALN